MMNKVILHGNLTRDPELRYTPKGIAVVAFGMAINRKWKSEDGEAKEEVTFVDVNAFGRQAETIAQYLRKGNQFLMEGRLKLDEWEDKQSHQKRTKLKVILESFSFVNGGNQNEERAPSASNAGKPVPTARQMADTAGASEEPPIEDDVPF